MPSFRCSIRSWCRRPRQHGDLAGNGHFCLLHADPFRETRAPTSVAEPKREGSSIVWRKVKAVTTPTPGTDVSRRVVASSCARDRICRSSFSCSRQTCSRWSAAQAVDRIGAEIGMFAHASPNPRFGKLQEHRRNAADEKGNRVLEDPPGYRAGIDKSGFARRSAEVDGQHSFGGQEVAGDCLNAALNKSGKDNRAHEIRTLRRGVSSISLRLLRPLPWQRILASYRAI